VIPGVRSRDPIEDALGRVVWRVLSYGADRAAVAFSGGVDSAVVLATSARALGVGAVRAVTAVSPSYPEGELEQARRVAGSLGVEHRRVDTGEVLREAYARNDATRCYHCKMELYTTLRRLRSMVTEPGAVLLAGANADDLGDFRPGLRAADELGVRNPLLEEGVGKPMVRAMARRLRLDVADKPALACLSSRVAYGIRITPELLSSIDRAEQAVRALGFDPVRVRHRGEAATIEVDPSEVARLTTDQRLPDLLRTITQLGWDEVSVDPDGYRAGNMNATLIDMAQLSNGRVTPGT
jgi:uncharacterized protein